MLFRREEYLRIVIVGHVDHGKSTLIGRLLYETDSLPKEKIKEIKYISKELGKEMELAFLMDHLKEEREKNITIDSAQIPFKTKKRNYTIIDAPGHFEFTKNMLTGASQAEAAILLLDVHEGICEQTRRHAYLLKLIGIETLMVAINKMDLVNYDAEAFERAKEKITMFLSELNLVPAFIIPTSSREGENISKKSNMAWYKGPTLLKALDSCTVGKVEGKKPLRFPVQDVYRVNGRQVLVGKIVSGTAVKGQEVVVQPSQQKTRIQEIVLHDIHKKRKAFREENVGIILSDTFLVQRGDVLSDAKNPAQTEHTFRGTLFWMGKESFKVNQTIALRNTTQKIECIAEKIEQRIDSSSLQVLEKNASEVRENEAGIVTFRSKEPLMLDDFHDIEEMGRFVIDQGYDIQGAGIVQF